MRPRKHGYGKRWLDLWAMEKPELAHKSMLAALRGRYCKLMGLKKRTPKPGQLRRKSSEINKEYNDQRAVETTSIENPEDNREVAARCADLRRVSVADWKHKITRFPRGAPKDTTNNQMRSLKKCEA